MNIKKFFSIEQKTPLTLVEGTTYQINGVNLESPFILTEQQGEALECIINDFIHSTSTRDKTFAFKGYAGTGKTSIINMVEQYIHQIGATIAFTAPTNRAVEVMKANNISSNVSTIHKLLGLHLHIDIEVFNADLSKLIKRGKNVNRFDFVVIDEASMIGDKLYTNVIRAFIETLGVRVIFMGDPAQLRPVKEGGTSLALTQPRLEYELTNVKRTSSAGILNLLDKIRNGQPYHVESSYEHCFTANKEAFLNYSLGKFSHLNEDPLHYRILCGTNAEVSIYNSYFHQKLFSDDAEYHIGELLMSYRNWNDEICNSTDYVIADIEETEFSIGNIEKGNHAIYKGYNLLFESCQIISVISRSNNFEPLKNYLHQLHDDKSQAAFDDLMKTYFFPEDICNRTGNVVLKKGIDYGYAMTVHKSQGGTYSHTGIVIDSFKSFKGNKDNYMELLYVAFSRCKHSFVGLDDEGWDDIYFLPLSEEMSRTVIITQSNEAELEAVEA